MRSSLGRIPPATAPARVTSNVTWCQAALLPVIARDWQLATLQPSESKQVPAVLCLEHCTNDGHNNDGDVDNDGQMMTVAMVVMMTTMEMAAATMAMTAIVTATLMVVKVVGVMVKALLLDGHDDNDDDQSGDLECAATHG